MNIQSSIQRHTRTLEALDARRRDAHQGVLDVAAGLEGASVGEDVDVAHGPLDADAAVRRAPGVGVQHVHELGVLLGQDVLVGGVLEGGPSRVQSCRGRKTMRREDDEEVSPDAVT